MCQYVGLFSGMVTVKYQLVTIFIHVISSSRLPRPAANGQPQYSPLSSPSMRSITIFPNRTFSLSSLNHTCQSALKRLVAVTNVILPSMGQTSGPASFNKATREVFPPRVQRHVGSADRSLWPVLMRALDCVTDVFNHARSDGHCCLVRGVRLCLAKQDSHVCDTRTPVPTYAVPARPVYHLMELGLLVSFACSQPDYA